MKTHTHIGKELQPKDAPRVSIVGLGKLGAPLAACYASRGCFVTGIDVDASKVEAINLGQAMLREPDLQQLMDTHGARLRATTDWNAAIGSTDITFIVVPTPSGADGNFSNRYVIEACRQIGQVLHRKGGHHLVVIASTVMPGAMDREILPALEKAAGKPAGAAFGLCYSPRFIALGSVVHDFLHPDLVLIGEADRRAGDALQSFYRNVHANNPPVARMSYASAELAKLAVNTFVTTKISFANMLSALCERLPGADVDAVTGALGLDSRIGKKYIKGGLGFGGPCFPRDNEALSALGVRLGVSTSIAEATQAVNRQTSDRLLAHVLAALPAGGTVGVLGLSYKPGTDVSDESPGMDLVRRLLTRSVRVCVHDPMALDNAIRELGDRPVTPLFSMDECARRADVLVLATPWPQFRGLQAHSLRGPRRRVVIDCWRMLDPKRYAAVADIVLLGIFAGAAKPIELRKAA